MTEVRRHTRRTASGKTATVRQHHRDTGGGSEPPAGTWHFRNKDDGLIYEVRPDGTVRPLPPETEERPLPPQAGSVGPAGPARDDGSWWDDNDEVEPAADYTLSDDVPHHARDVSASAAEPEMSDAFRNLMKQNPSLGEGFGRLSMLRNAGYDGPIDQDGNPTSRKGLFRARVKAQREQDAARKRFMYAKTIPERDAAQHDYQAAQDKLDLLPGALDRLHD